MPEYLAPGVYVEEVSFRQKSIEGVSTSVAGFIGPTRYGPVGGTPELITSFSDFSRIYGGIDDLTFATPTSNQINYMAHAVRGFFDNGGARLYVTRVFQPDTDLANPGADLGKAIAPLDSPRTTVLHARFPGSAGDMSVVIALRLTPNVLNGHTLQGVRAGDVVYVIPTTAAGVTRGFHDVSESGGVQRLIGPSAASSPDSVTTSGLPSGTAVHKVSLNIRVRRGGRFEDEVAWEDLSPTPGSRSAVTDLFVAEPRSRQQYLSIPFAIDTGLHSGADIVDVLLGDVVLAQLHSLAAITGREILERPVQLTGGDDGRLPSAEFFRGSDEGLQKTGLTTFEDIDEISIVATPGSTFDYGTNQPRADSVVQALLAHVQKMRYRVAVVDSPNAQILSEVRSFRGKLDSNYAALYYPWVRVVNPLDPEGRAEIDLPPSGFVSGIYARTDINHGVFKAPANEVVLGAVDFERLLNKAEQDALNPLGVNCFRFFENRGFRLWGARTIASDPEWKYISVRRYFAYLEHSIDKGTQWAVFENNGETLWANVRRTVEDFLFNEWRSGALLGTKPEEAFFVRCDRSTMSQNDLDNGRLVCLIGVAVVKPAEFVIFRIGQMTADSRR